MINIHNHTFQDPALNETKSPYGRLKISRNVYFTAYLIASEDSKRLISQVLDPMLPSSLADSSDLKCMANSILITPRPASQYVINQAGGIGKRFTWQITGTGVFANKVWAARVSPVPATEHYFTENSPPLLVLAVRRGARPSDAARIQDWHPIPADKVLTVETVVGEKAVLRIEEDTAYGRRWDTQSMNRSNKRRHQQERDEEILYPHAGRNGYDPEGPPRRSSYYNPRFGDNRQYHDDASRRGGPYRGRGRGNTRGRGFSNRGGSRGRGRGRDFNPVYRSLDEGGGYDGGNDDRRGPSGGAPVMNY